ncbi:MAG: restriction endonuclease subunit S [Sphingobacteriales bacterium]|nr:MAG: restriction endonuclease subunit S [Sphingobacteriales bacterium]
MINRPGYKHTPLGWIPEEWEIYPVGKAFKICNNLRYPISEEVRRTIPGQYPYYGPTKVQDFINEYRVEGKYALIGEDGDHFLKWKELPMTLLVDGKFNVNNHAHLIQGNEISVTEWFFYFFNHKELTTYLTRQGAGRYKLTKDALSKMPIPLPSVQEQSKITTILAVWDNAITKTQQIIAQLQHRNKGLMRQLLTSEKRIKGFSEPWKELHLAEAFNERNETGYVNLNLLSVGSLGVYPQSQSEKRDTSNSDKAKYKRICPGDIGYNTMRMWQGRSALSSLEGIVSPAYTIVTPKDGQHSQFYAYLFKLPSVVNKFFRNSQGLVEDTLNCKFKDFSIVKVEVPEYEEQVAIANVLTTAQTEIKSYEQKLNALQQQKKGLMQKLLTGEVRVKIEK